MEFGRIVVTGSAGRIAQAVRKGLAGRCDALVLTDRTLITDLGPREEFIQAELSDGPALAQIARGAQAILHLGGSAQERDWPLLLRSNIEGTINVYEAARLGEVARVFLASSNHVTGMLPVGARPDGNAPPAPDSRYAATKIFAEGLASLYALKHSVRSLCVRIGSFKVRPTSRRDLATWLSHGDLVRLVDLGLTGDFLVETVYGVSANTRSWWSNERAHALGYRPQDNAEEFAAEVESVLAPHPLHRILQGGDRVSDELSGDQSYVRAMLAEHEDE